MEILFEFAAVLFMILYFSTFYKFKATKLERTYNLPNSLRRFQKCNAVVSNPAFEPDIVKILNCNKERTYTP